MSIASEKAEALGTHGPHFHETRQGDRNRRQGRRLRPFGQHPPAYSDPERQGREHAQREYRTCAIKRATEKDAADYKEVIYEGYGPHGIAFLVETATDNTNRTVANVRMHFNKCGGTLGNSGSVAFMFDHKCVFKFHAAEGADMEELELE